MDELHKNPSDFSLLQRIERKLHIFFTLPFEINLWYVQNVYYDMAKTTHKEFLLKAKSGDENVARWVEVFKKIGQDLFFNIAAVLPGT